MTENRRIVLNIIATYGRSLYGLALGLCTGRWLLMALGEIDYGLISVVGAITGCVTFFCGLLSSAVGRYYTFAIGEAKITGLEGLENCRKWFNTSVLLYTIIPVVLIVIGWPIGEYAIRNGWIYIPFDPDYDRVQACLWVFRISCVSAFLGLITVPANAMYGAHQYIAELTVYSFITSTLNAIFLYYIKTHEGHWLVWNALWGAVLALAPNIIITIRAFQLFPECRFRMAYLWSWERTKALFIYASAQFFDLFVTMLRHQGIAVLVNRYVAPIHTAANASITVANTVTTHWFTRASCMSGAFAPALTTAYGAQDHKRMLALAFGTCKIGVLLMLIFALPMMLEVDEVMLLWLEDPPEFAPRLCNFFLTALLIERIALGHQIAVNASGKVMKCQSLLGLVNFFLFPLAWLGLALGYSIYTIGFVHIAMMIGNVCVRVYYARKNVGMGVRYWIFTVVIPLALLSAICLVIGSIPRFLLEASFWRVCVTTLTIEAVFLPLAWFVVLTKDERHFVSEKWAQIVSRLKR